MGNMPVGPRYAIYFVPAAGSRLYRFGSRLIGYDCYTGETIPPHQDDALPDDWTALTRTPRRYGFHATLKAPFALAEGCSEAALREAFAAFCAKPRETASVALALRTIDDFAALVPSEACDTLAKLAAACTTCFDGFHAAPTPDELRRRKPEMLTTRQGEHLANWGYPYVFEDYRCHMTLSGSLPRERIAHILESLDRLFHRACLGKTHIDGIALLRQDCAEASFRVMDRLPLAQVRSVLTQGSASIVRA